VGCGPVKAADPAIHGIGSDPIPQASEFRGNEDDGIELMKRERIRRGVLAGVIAACLASAACGIAPATAGRDASTLVVDTVNYPSTLDPGQQYDTDSYSVYRNIFDQLLHRDPQTNAITPWIASSWSQVDPKTWKFAIRPEVTFSDGSPLTAQDAAFSISRILDKTFGSQQYANFSVISNASVEGGDLVVRTSVPSPTLLSYLTTLSVVPEAYVKRLGDKAFAVKPIGSGPYVLTSAGAGS
jgi:peptide/nickel transport system substrate-binding protein